LSKQHLVFDCEIIGDKKPVFLVCVKNLNDPGVIEEFWLHKRGHMRSLNYMLKNSDYTWVSFNGINFDAPLIAAAIQGADGLWLKDVAGQIIEKQMKHWQTYRDFGIGFIDYDHIDLIETAPGVMINLKTYAGRMSYPSMVDMPFEHTKDLTPAECKQLAAYCINDIGVTEELFKRLSTEITLREQLGEQHGIDLRSKSDAQCAEAILKQEVGIKSGDKFIPGHVRYTAPSFIKTRNPLINQLIEDLEAWHFTINKGNGSPELPAWLSDSVYKIGSGLYQVGIGGLHSTHDLSVYYTATETRQLSDFDVASYYPNIMLKCGLAPKLGGSKGQRFMDVYKEIYDERMTAKHAGNKRVSNTLKIVLNGTFGKLGSVYASFYSPELLLAVTITGQLNLLCLIDELEKIKDVYIRSANTDGIMVDFPRAARDKVLKVFEKNSKLTGFEYEETPYRKYAATNVNNYIAITTDNKAKRKGLYASMDPKENPLYLMKNPTMEVCSTAAVLYLMDGTDPAVTIRAEQRIPAEFMAVRNIKGGGIQHKKYIEIDDWELTDEGWVYPGISTKPVKRKSRPKPRLVGVNGKPFGRVARWYMTTAQLPAITTMENEITGVRNGGQVAKTEGGRLCLLLPTERPRDLNYNWYIAETWSMLKDMGVPT